MMESEHVYVLFIYENYDILGLPQNQTFIQLFMEYFYQGVQMLCHHMCYSEMMAKSDVNLIITGPVNILMGLQCYHIKNVVVQRASVEKHE